ncbi:Uncharacterised protein [Edwardsiella hoshinae]|uniref:Uncharacterized protein n=1 Tax=Edwardsiella hoshinae TaxID=93378 RepID=A0A376DAW4_9GAMM|nr:Uncharacterised protein [Edwardsiella hoshinae]
MNNYGHGPWAMLRENNQAYFLYLSYLESINLIVSFSLVLAKLAT